MSQAAQLAQRVIVLHREPGYLRLELPAELCAPEASVAIEQGMAGLAGVSVAVIDRGWRRLSLRFDQTICSAAQVARQLFSLLDTLPTPTVEEPEATIAEPANNGLQPLLDKFKAMLTPSVEAPAGSLQAKVQPIIASALTEKAIINFFNDLVAFYLIKAHWDLITKRWLQQPLAHSNAWMTTFYLVFLLVRYRKTNLKK
jgi:hypothetical protein